MTTNPSIWCHRGGCPDIDHLEVAALLTPIIIAAYAADAALNSMDGDWEKNHQQLHGDGPDYIDRVLVRSICARYSTSLILFSGRETKIR